MKLRIQKGRLLVRVALALSWAATPLTGAVNGIVWRSGQGDADADIQAWPLSRVLESLAGTTGWQIYVEPETDQTVTTRFQQLRPAEALRRLLGDLNFALLPQTNGPAKLFVFRSSVQDATQLVAAPAAKVATAPVKPIGNELIVRLKPGSKETIERLAARLGAKVVDRIDDLNAYRLRFDDDSAAQSARTELETTSDVASVESNFNITPPSRLEPLAFSSAPPLALKPNVSPNTEHTVVALIDTPISGSQSGIKDFLLPAVSVAGAADMPAHLLTHGTAMAETILRALAQTPQDPKGTSVRILPVDVYGSNPATTTFDVVRGLYAAVQYGPTIINLSLGSEGDSPLLHEVIQAIRKQGPLVVGAAGNEPRTTPVYPAAYPEVLAVTAGDRQGRIAPYANRGDFVDLVAPGTSIVQFENQAYLGTGTSYSAAYVSGVAAGLASTPGKTPAEVEAAVRQKFAPNAAGVSRQR